MREFFYLVSILAFSQLVDVVLRSRSNQKEVNDLKTELKELKRDFEDLKRDVKQQVLRKVPGEIYSTSPDIVSGKPQHLFDDDMDSCITWENGRAGGVIWVSPVEDMYMDHLRVKMRDQSTEKQPNLRISACVLHNVSGRLRRCYDHEECLWTGATANEFHIYHCNKQQAKEVRVWVPHKGESVEVCEIEMYGYKLTMAT